MKTFATFFIGGQKWTVYSVSPKNKNLKIDGKQKAGTCQYEAAKIFLANDLSEQTREDTLLHEMLHALLYVTGTGKIFNDNEEAEEDFVLAMTPVMHRLLKDLGFKFPA